jgi:hypothetical protein
MGKDKHKSYAYDRGRTAVNELVKFNISVLLV